MRKPGWYWCRLYDGLEVVPLRWDGDVWSYADGVFCDDEPIKVSEKDLEVPTDL